jgi:hypothetical protein
VTLDNVVFPEEAISEIPVVILVTEGEGTTDDPNRINPEGKTKRIG